MKRFGAHSRNLLTRFLASRPRGKSGLSYFYAAREMRHKEEKKDRSSLTDPLKS